jgi:neutral amino acid transport system permease protein
MGRAKYCGWMLLLSAGVLPLLAVPRAEAQDAPDEPAEEPGVVRGVLNYRDDGEQVRVEGVEITVESADGSFTETVTTDEEGAYEVEIPQEGDYTVSIDDDALPDGVSLQQDRTSVTLHFRAGQSRAVTFPLTTGGSRGATLFDRTVRLTVEGIRFGLIIAMCAIGLSLIYGTTGLVNFAHGEMVTFGALMAYLFNRTMGLTFLLAAALGILSGALFGWLFNRGIWRPLRNRGTGLVAMMIVSIGLGFAIRYAYLFQFRGDRRSFDGFQGQSPIEWGPIRTVPRDIWIMGLSVLILIGVALFLQLTLAGKAMRAVSDNRELAEATGINVERVISWVWIAGGALAAIGGIFLALDEQIQWQMGFQLLLLIFAAVTLGGLGTAYGALVGGLAIGLFIQLSTLFIDSEFKTAAALAVLILVLLIRPQGIMGQSERVG